MEFLNLIAERHTMLLSKTLEHVLLVGSACGLAVAVGVPLGMLVGRHQKLAGPVMGIAGVVQTIPSLAMLALLQVWMNAMGFLPAFTALVLYALLPIVRNTYAGLQNVGPAILEAANGLGYTRTQRLWKVELPLASPIIMAGIRTATVINIGIATLSTLIGAGGLGDFINRGLSIRSRDLILLGVVGASILALLVDFLLHLAEKALKKKLRQSE
ncbi:MAG: ABC transporter permease [Kiritimatiellia bacterium]